MVVLQPPILPDYALRAEIRKTGPRPIKEPLEDQVRRRTANEFLLSSAGDRLTVVEVEDLFLNDAGDIRFADNRGRQLFRDRTHVSYYGGLRVRDRIVEAIETALERSR